MRQLGRLPVVMAFVLAASPSAGQNPDPTLDELLAVPVHSASRLEQTAMRAPASVSILTAEEIARRGYRTLAEALASVTGLYLTYDRSYSYLGVRGFSRPGDFNTRVLVLVDGYRLNEDFYGYAAIGTDLPIDLRAVERIEVARGPGSAGFGTAAMLAVINVVLRGPETSHAGALSLEVGDFGREAGSFRGVTETGKRSGFAWSIAAHGSDGESRPVPAEAAELASATTTRADWDRGAGGTVRARIGRLELTALATERDKGIPTGAYGTDPADRESATSDRWGMLGASWRTGLGSGWSLAARASAGRAEYDGVYASPEITYLDSSDNLWWGGELRATLERRPDRRLTLGAEYRDNTVAEYRAFDAAGGPQDGSSSPYRIASIFGEREWQLSEELIVLAGLRYDRYSHCGDFASPRLALVYLPDRDDSLKLLFGSAYRAPNLYELTYDNAEFIANPDLEAERVETVELVWERRLGGSTMGSLALFENRITDLIELRPTSDGPVRFENVGRARSRGLEAEVSVRSESGWSGFASFAYARATDSATGEALTNSPERMVKLGAATPSWGPWRASAQAGFESSRRTLRGDDTGSSTIVDALLGWQAALRPVGLELQVRNLLDAERRHPGGIEHPTDFLPQDGRGLTLRCEIRFD